MSHFRRWAISLSVPALLLGGAGMASVTSGPTSAGATAPASGSLIQTANVLPGLSHATFEGVTSATTRLTVDIGLATADSSAETAFLSSLYDPKSSSYHQFLSPSQFDSRFGVPAATVNSAEAWLRSGGLAVSYVSGAGDLIATQGTVAQFGALLHTSFGDYSVGTYKFVANQSAPSVPQSLPITDVVGLNTLERMWTEPEVAGTAVLKDAAPKPAASTSYTGEDVAQDLWGVYDAPASDEGQGETAGMFGAGYSNGVVSDLRVFEQRMGLPVAPVRVVNEDEVTNPPVPSDNDIVGDDEWNLDTQAITGMAPKLSQLDMYFASTPLDADTAVMFADWASDPQGPKQMNASFGECESDPTSPYLKSLSTLAVGQGAIGNQLQLLSDQSLEQAVVEGRTLFSSAGDTGGSCPAVILPVLSAGNGVIPQPLPLDQNYPCVSAYAVCVGGTVVTTNGTTNPAATGAPTADYTKSPTRVDEQAWAFTGGGTAANVPRPSYQAGVSAIDEPCTELSQPNGTAIPLGTTCRGVPDVAAMSGSGLVDGELVGANSYLTNIDMMPSGVGGTSLSSPLTVGMWTRIQAAAPATAKGVFGGLGFANETFYAVGTGKLGKADDFYDITSDELPTGNFYHQAGPGWDYTSGWGAIDVANFIRDVDHDPSLQPTHASANADYESFFPAVGCSTTLTAPLGNAYDTTLSFEYPYTNDPQLNITSASLSPSADGKDLVATFSGPDLSTTGPIDTIDGFNFYMAWTYGGKTYFAGAEIDPGQQLPQTPATNSIPAPVSAPLGTVVYGDGLITGDSLTFSHTDSGSFAGHTFTVVVPMANVGSPPSGSLLLFPYAFDTLPDGVLVPFATDEATAPKPGAALKIGPNC